MEWSLSIQCDRFMDSGSASLSNNSRPAVSVSTSRSPESRDESLRQDEDSPFSFASPSSGPRREDPPSGVLEFKWQSISCCSVRKGWRCASHSVRGNVIGQLLCVFERHGVFWCVRTHRQSFHPSGKTSAWGLRFRIDHGLFRLRSGSTIAVHDCGVFFLYQGGLSTLSFNGIARDAVQFDHPTWKVGLFRGCSNHFCATRLSQWRHLFHRLQQQLVSTLREEVVSSEMSCVVLRLVQSLRLPSHPAQKSFSPLFRHLATLQDTREIVSTPRKCFGGALFDFESREARALQLVQLGELSSARQARELDNDTTDGQVLCVAHALHAMSEAHQKPQSCPLMGSAHLISFFAV